MYSSAFRKQISNVFIRVSRLEILDEMEEWTLLMVSKDQGIVALHVKILINAKWVSWIFNFVLFPFYQGHYCYVVATKGAMFANLLEDEKAFDKRKSRASIGTEGRGQDSSARTDL